MYADVADIARDAMVFRAKLQRTKAMLEPEGFWYPYDSLSNFVHFDRMLQGENRGVFEAFQNLSIVDIGAADGDMAFFFESLGNTVDVVDHAPTNFNGLRGIERLRNHLDSSVTVYDIDLDRRFDLPREHYDVAFFLGILYHLKNPYSIMEGLAKRVDTCFLSTKVTKFAGSPPLLIDSLPVAYLLEPREANNDPTNFWVFTISGLKRLLDRTGWDVLDYTTVGNTHNSDPAKPEGDERAFCYLRSRRLNGQGSAPATG